MYLPKIPVNTILPLAKQPPKFIHMTQVHVHVHASLVFLARTRTRDHYKKMCYISYQYDIGVYSEFLYLEI